MTNTNELQAAIAESGITIVALARKLGITREALYSKIQNKTEFKASEIVALSSALRLSARERDRIFFAKVG